MISSTPWRPNNRGMFSFGRPQAAGSTYSGPAPVNSVGALGSMAPKPMQEYTGDDRSTGGLTGGGGGAAPWTTQQEVENALHGPKPASGGSFLDSITPSWKDMGGAIAGQFPGGSPTYAMANLMLNDNPTSRDKASAGFSIMGGPLAGASKIADLYAGTQYARNHPMESYLFGGNADQQGAQAADKAFRAGFGPGQMAGLYDSVAAQKNLGGAGNTDKAINDWRMANFNDGKIHIGEPGFENPYSRDVSGTIDNTAVDAGNYTPDFGNQQITVGEPNVSGTVNNSVSPGSGAASPIDFGGDTSIGGDNQGSGYTGGQSDAWEAGNYYAKGGRVRRPMPGMHNPPGPDDQMIAAKTGEVVLNEQQIERLGRGKVAAALRSGR